MSSLDRSNARDVVTRLLPPELSEDASIARFTAELAEAARLYHPHVLPVLSGGAAADGSLSYQMSFAAGEWLPARLLRDEMALAEAVDILSDIAGTLEYAHRLSAVHGSLAPDKVVLSFGNTLVTDFGVARAVVRARGKPLVGAHITDEPVIGDPAYLAPEQYTALDIESPVDVYAWGVIAYLMLSGEHPFEGRETTRELMDAHEKELPVHLLLKIPTLPVSLSTLVMSCLEKRPSDRPSASQLVLTLAKEEILEDSADATFEAEERNTGRQRIIGIALAAVAGLVALGLPPLAARLRKDVVSPGTPVVAAAVVADSAPVFSSIAVLPLQRSIDNAPEDYLSDGIVRELTHALSLIPGVKLTGAASVSSTKLASLSALQIAKMLGVSGVVSGSIRQNGNTVRVRSQLVDALTGRELWAGSFERPLAELFKIQDDITSGVVTALSHVVTGSDAAALAGKARGTMNAPAYMLFLQAARTVVAGGAANALRAVASLQHALELDGTFARAAAAQSRAYLALAKDSVADRDSSLQLAAAAARRALSIDPASPDAHAAMGDMLASSWKFAEAAIHYERALQDEPGDASLRVRLAKTLLAAGSIDRALPEARAATQQDPLSASTALLASLALLDGRKFQESMVESRLVLAMDTSLVEAARTLARAYLFAGRADSAIRVLQPILARDSAAAGIAATMFLAQMAAGHVGEARALREAMLSIPSRSPDYDAMVIALAVGNRSAAVAALSRSAARRGDIAEVSENLGCDPLFDSLKRDTGYKALMSQLGIPICALSTPWPVRP